jgi:hypothetical protein
MRSARAAHCPPLSRPHNLHYVGMPAAQGLMPCALVDARVLLIAIGPINSSAQRATLAPTPRSVPPPRMDRSLFL